MNALSAGLRYANGEVVIVLDGDLQDPPELIPSFYSAWQKNNADVVYGQRDSSEEGLVKRMFSHLFYVLMRHMSEIDIPMSTGTYSLLNRKVVNIINALPEKARFFAGQRAWVGGRQIAVSYTRLERKCGKSRVGFSGLLRLARIAIIGFSSKPLRYASIFSFVSAMTLFCIGLMAILIRIYTNLAIPGWATFTTLIGFIGCTQSIVLAAISEYVAVIYNESKRRPSSIVLDIIKSGESRGICMSTIEECSD